ncbi:MAG TPA: PTS sugar transporter subunit IIA [bacterium]|nr:PTS sugar transporter subunit IIA [bacterium]
MSLLARHLSPARILTLRSRTKEAAIRELAAALTTGDSGVSRETVVAAVQARERLVSSWIAPGIAIPHARLPGTNGIEVVMGRSRAGVAWDSADGGPVTLLFLIVSSDQDPDEHVHLLAEIARTLRDRALVRLLQSARSAAETWRLLIAHSGGQEPGREEPPPARGRLSRLLFAHALSVAEEVKARAVVLHGDAVGSLGFVEDMPSDVPLILVTSAKPVDPPPPPFALVLQVPFPTINRADQVDLALLFAASRGVLTRGDTVVSLSGVPGSGSLDTLVVVDVGRELPSIFAKQGGAALGDVEPQVLEKVLQIAMDIAREGREGHPVGATFVVGDYERVVQYCRQMVINPFRGYQPEEKSILDPSLGETVKEFSTIDGAFTMRGDGEIMSAGTFLRPEHAASALPAGLGARHAAAAAITLGTGALAVVISQSTGRVSLFKEGRLVMGLDKGGASAEA